MEFNLNTEDPFHPTKEKSGIKTICSHLKSHRRPYVNREPEKIRTLKQNQTTNVYPYTNKRTEFDSNTSGKPCDLCGNSHRYNPQKRVIRATAVAPTSLSQRNYFLLPGKPTAPGPKADMVECSSSRVRRKVSIVDPPAGLWPSRRALDSLKLGDELEALAVPGLDELTFARTEGKFPPCFMATRMHVVQEMGASGAAFAPQQRFAVFAW